MQRIWTDEERASLRLLWKQQVVIKQIAFELDRSISSVKHQARMLKLPARRIGNSKWMLRVNTSPELKEALTKRAFAERVTVSEYIRRLIRRDVGMSN